LHWGSDRLRDRLWDCGCRRGVLGRRGKRWASRWSYLRVRSIPPRAGRPSPRWCQWKLLIEIFRSRWRSRGGGRSSCRRESSCCWHRHTRSSRRRRRRHAGHSWRNRSMGDNGLSRSRDVIWEVVGRLVTLLWPFSKTLSSGCHWVLGLLGEI